MFPADHGNGKMQPKKRASLGDCSALVRGEICGIFARVFTECLTGGRRPLTVIQTCRVEGSGTSVGLIKGIERKAGVMSLAEDLASMWVRSSYSSAFPTTPLRCGQGGLASSSVDGRKP